MQAKDLLIRLAERRLYHEVQLEANVSKYNTYNYNNTHYDTSIKHTAIGEATKCSQH